MWDQALSSCRVSARVTAILAEIDGLACLYEFIKPIQSAETGLPNGPATLGLFAAVSHSFQKPIVPAEKPNVPQVAQRNPKAW